MTLNDFHKQLAEVMYIEDKNLINIILGSIVANLLRIGDPVWLTIIGPSSGGKSQLIRPFGLANDKYIHPIDDLTPNTFLAGNKKYEETFLGQVGDCGILSMDDLTVLFSKNAEERAEILSQFRMIYDGRYTKASGQLKEPHVWKGYMGMIAGSTPSIYRYFNEVADMGERFISYRMKKMDIDKFVEFVTNNPNTSQQLNHIVSDIIQEYLPQLVQSLPDGYKPQLHDNTKVRIARASRWCTLMRTPVHINEHTGFPDEFAEPETPIRVMKQLTYLAQGLQLLQEDREAELNEELMSAVEHCAYSLANDKRRSYIRSICALNYAGQQITLRNVGANVGLHESVVEKGLAQLQAIGLIEMSSGDRETRVYSITHRDFYDLILHLEGDNIKKYVLSDGF